MTHTVKLAAPHMPAERLFAPCRRSACQAAISPGAVKGMKPRGTFASDVLRVLKERLSGCSAAVVAGLQVPDGPRKPMARAADGAVPPARRGQHGLRQGVTSPDCNVS